MFRVVEVDVVTERDIPALADGLFDASSAESGTRGPAVVAVMARGRQQLQAIELTAYTIVRGRLAIELAQGGRSRGLAILDLVESALSGLPPHGLPPLLVESAVAPLPAGSAPRGLDHRRLRHRAPRGHRPHRSRRWPPRTAGRWAPSATT